MSSRGSSTRKGNPNKPPRNSHPAPDVRDFRKKLKDFLSEKDPEGRVWASSQWGVYAFYDYDGEPIYVGQTNEKLSVRVQRHLTNQRTDAVAMRILDILEVAEIQLWPLWNLAGVKRGNNLSAEEKLILQDAKDQLNAAEYSAYLRAIEASRFKAILNEKIPPKSDPVELPPAIRSNLVDAETRAYQGHADIRIGRRAETISRLADVARERGEVSDGLRRVLVIQAIRLTYIAAERLAFIEGRPAPDPSAIDTNALIGSVLLETGPTEEEIESEDISD